MVPWEAILNKWGSDQRQSCSDRAIIGPVVIAILTFGIEVCKAAKGVCRKMKKKVNVKTADRSVG